MARQARTGDARVGRSRAAAPSRRGAPRPRGPGRPPGGDAEIRAALLTTCMRMLATNRWLPALIVHEVLHEGGQLREQFIGHFAGRLARHTAQRFREGVLVRPQAMP